MAYTTPTKPTQGDPTKKSLVDLLIDNGDDHETRLLALGTISGVKNGSMESGASDTPSSWTWTAYTGGTKLLDTTDQQHGGKAFKITSPGGAGNGGGYIETTDFFEVSPNRPLTVLWEMKSSAAAVNNKVEITWYTAAQVSISTTSLYDSSSNPTAWTAHSANATPPSTARYAKLRLTGGHTSSTTAGSIWFDNVIVQNQQRRVPAMEVLTSGVSWTVPNGVHFVRVRLWGGGGDGNGTTGGSSGGYGEAIHTVTPGAAITIAIGAGGTGGGAGGTTTFDTINATGGAAAGGAAGTSTAAFAITGQVGGATAATADHGGSAPMGGSGGYQAGNGVVPGGGAGSSGEGAAGRIIVEY